MPRSAIYALSLVAVVAGLALAPAARAGGQNQGTLNGRVLVLDGDTITVGGQEVRLWGIDAADLNQDCVPRKTLTCGEYARIALQQLATGRIARCEVKDRPAFSVRVVARCEITEDGREIDLSREMVRLGYAYAEESEAGRAYAAQELRILSFKRPALWRKMHAREEARRR